MSPNLKAKIFAAILNSKPAAVGFDSGQYTPVVVVKSWASSRPSFYTSGYLKLSIAQNGMNIILVVLVPSGRVWVSIASLSSWVQGMVLPEMLPQMRSILKSVTAKEPTTIHWAVAKAIFIAT